jgi:hypothetical protein
MKGAGMSEGADAAEVAYCGLYCGDCFGHKGRVADLARDLRKELRDSKFKRFADFMATTGFGAVYKDYDACYEVLGAMVKFRCRRGCRGGGGPPRCKIRDCCRKKGLQGCWECGDFEGCGKLDFLGGVHGDAHLKNLRILSRKGPEAFITGKRHW